MPVATTKTTTAIYLTKDNIIELDRKKASSNDEVCHLTLFV